MPVWLLQAGARQTRDSPCELEALANLFVVYDCVLSMVWNMRWRGPTWHWQALQA